MLNIGDKLASRYLIKSIIRSGVLHDYWLAYDEFLYRQVTIKTIRKNQDFQEIDRIKTFSYDHRWLAKLEHPNILPIYDFGETDEIFYVVTRYIVGQSLTDSVKTSKWTIHEVIELVSRLAPAIDFMHSHNIVHADLNPNNILIGDQQQPFISNLSVAAMLQVMKEDGIKGFVGTSGFTAPELLMSGEITPAVDLFSLGMTIFFVFSGIWPTEFSISKGYHVPPIRFIKPELPLSVELIINKLINHNPLERFASATMAAQALTKAFYSGQSSIQGRVFISYATKDKNYVHQLAKELRRLNIDIWIDQDIEKGSDWGDSIEDSLKATDIMLLVLSEASSVSEYVIHEWSFFMGLGKPIYPFVLHSSPPKAIHPRLNRVQHIMGTDDMFTDVSRIVDALAGGNQSRIQAET
jgi:serine/threonine protein kinase